MRISIPSGQNEHWICSCTVGVALIGMAHDIVGGFVGGQDDGMRGRFIEAGDLAHRFDESSCQRQKAEVAGNRQGPGRPWRPCHRSWFGQEDASRSGTSGL